MIKKMLKCSWLIIGAAFAITAFFTAQIVKINIENTVRMYMPQSSESYKRMIQTEEDFGSMTVLGVSFETEGESIITPEYLQILQSITEQIESVDYVESIDSLSNIDFIYGDNGSLVAGSLLGDNYTGTSEDMQNIKKKLVDWQEMYNRVIITDDGKTSQMMITLQPKDENGNMLNSTKPMKALHDIKAICEKETADTDLEVRYFGDPVLSNDAHDFMIADLVVLIPFVAMIVLLSLYFSFHSWSGTLLPLITVLMSTIWSVGIMCMLNITFTIVGSMIPVCLIACGSAYGIHVLTHYYIGLDKVEGEMTKEKHADAIVYGLKDVWIAVLLAAVTTIAGFISNVTSPILPLRSFSVFAAAGVAFSLILSITLIPAMLYVIPISKVGKHQQKKNSLSTKFRERIEKQLARRGGKDSNEATSSTLYAIYHFFSGTKPRLIVSTLVIIVVAAFGVHQLIVDTALVNYFPMNSKFRQDIAYVDENLAGSNTMFFIISGKEKAPSDTAVSAESTADDIASDFDFTGGDSLPDSSVADAIESDFDFGESDDFGFGSTSDDFGFGNAGDDFGFGTDGTEDKTESQEPVAQKEYYMLTNPEILKAVDGLQDYLMQEHGEHIGKIVSFTTFIKRMNQVMHVPVADDSDAMATDYANALSKSVSAQSMLELLHDAYAAAGGETATINEIIHEIERKLNYNGMNYYEVPYDIAKYPVASREELGDLVTQYLYLLSSDQIKRFANNMTMPTSIRTQVQLCSHSTDITSDIIADAKAYAAKYFPEGYTIEATGNGEMEYTMTKMVIRSQLVSIAFSLLMVFIIISLSFKSPWAGIIGAIPLGMTILLNFMVMGYVGIALDLCTSVVASVAIGVGIDYTIHFMETYRSERAKSDVLEYVTKRTFSSSGKGIITNAIAVGLGFCVLLFSKFIILRYIGALVAVVMFTSSALAMTVIPGLLNAFDPKFMWSEEEKQRYKANIAEESAKK